MIEKILWYSVFGILCLADAFYTQLNITAGFAHEANPLLAKLIENFGFKSMWLVKATGLILLFLGLKFVPVRALQICCFIFGVVVVYQACLFKGYL